MSPDQDGPAERGRRGLRVVLVQTQAEAAGAQEISRLLSRGLTARGHEVHQLFFFRRTDAFDADPKAVICSAVRPRGLAGGLRLLASLHRHLRRLRPDVTISFQHNGNLLGASVARLAGTRRVIANHNGLQEILSPLSIRLDRWLGTLGIYDRIVVNSAAMAAEYAGYPARYRDRLARIDHGFGVKGSRLGKREARSSLGLPESDILLGCVARLHPSKHLDAAIRLLPGRPAWRLALAGQGPHQAALEALAVQLGCRDRLHLLGELAPDGVGDLLAALDVFVFPSRSETFGLAVVEAAQAGVPVVANHLPVLEDVLSHDGRPCALFVDVDDQVAFAAAVDRLLHDPALAGELTARGRRLRERFPVDAMVDAYEALLVEGGGAARGPGRPA